MSKKKKDMTPMIVAGNEYEPVHSPNPRILGEANPILGEDAVSDAQGYGSRPSSPDFIEGPSETETHLVVTASKSKSSLDTLTTANVPFRKVAIQAPLRGRQNCEFVTVGDIEGSTTL